MSLDDHIDKVCSKLNKSLALFQNSREFINRRAAFNFYYNFFSVTWYMAYTYLEI